MCELCNKNKTFKYFLDVGLCENCYNDTKLALKGNEKALLKIANSSNYPNATADAKEKICNVFYRKNEKIKNEIEEKTKEKEKELSDFFANNDYLGYYEYKVIDIMDGSSGSVDTSAISNILNKLGKEGWRIKCAFTNEIGKNSNSQEFFGKSTGTNATIDQNILILERFIKF